MLTPAHLPELERLLASLVDAYEATNAEAGIALRTGDEGAFTSASMRLDRAARSLVAFTRAAQSAPPSPVDGEIERLVEDLIGEGCKALAPSEPKVRAARTALLAAIRRALADRDARIAALEAEVADKDTATVLAQNAAERRGKRIAALEAGLREACDALQDWMPSSDAAHDLGIRLRSLADATKK